ncbi:MAG: energy transducer TonB [Dysgonomonas sp.]
MNLLNYIKGLRKGEEAQRIERESMRDPFLYEAIEGFDSVKDDHIARIDEIKSRLSTQKKKEKKKLPIVRGIAASVILFLALGGYFLIDGHKSDLYAQQTANKNIIDIYVPKVFYEENIAIIAQQNTTLAKSFRPSVSRFSIDEITNTSITQSEMEILANDQLAMSNTPIIIYMPNSEKYKVKNNNQYIQNLRAEATPAAHDITSTESATSSADSLTVDMDVVYPTGFIAESISPSSTNITDETILAENKNDILSGAVAASRSVKKQNLAKDSEPISASSKMRSSIQSADQNLIIPPHPIIGYEKYDAYLQGALQHPTDDICKDKKGKVLLEFSIDKDGQPYDIRVKYSLCGTCDKEAIRLVKSGPKWTLGEQRVTIKVEF